jgi:ElaB/YqjD/DUF883 family membrane-anchored ribosome-binding protein
MDERRLESVIGHAQERVQETANQAGAYVSERARAAGDEVERLTGRSLDSWTRDARHYVQTHPLQAIAITIGLGFVLGKLLARD